MTILLMEGALILLLDSFTILLWLVQTPQKYTCLVFRMCWEIKAHPDGRKGFIELTLPHYSSQQMKSGQGFKQGLEQSGTEFEVVLICFQYQLFRGRISLSEKVYELGRNSTIG